jgi:hypothetical protein
MLLTRSRFQTLIIAIVCFFGILIFSTQLVQAKSLPFQVNCLPPRPGTYSLGWGTSRLIVPKQGQPYGLFRGNTSPNTSTLCKAGDNIGLVAFQKDGTVWAYVQVSE